jgi:hypothetical protein
MRHRKVRTAFHWITTFINVTLHSCAPAYADDIKGPTVVATIPGNEAGLDRVSARRGTQPELSMTHQIGCEVIGIRQSVFG